ncbi:hypothetical protein C0992_000034 [Termitomyces sp. T32_za158]|nr:hypothetical protein C0992_000034 [Termitomyces sp. T32_za158]
MTIAGNSQSTSRPPVAKPRPTYCLESDVSAKQTTEVKKKSKSHRRDVDSVEETPTKALIKKEKKSKKRKREAERPVDEHDLENQEGLEKKVKKRVKRLEENLSDPTITSNVVAPARKRKNKTGFSDPNEDASLPEQSRKSYAFLQFHRPSKWKFNKARQNWILRNIWSNEMIPEEHIPLVYGYLAKVQGGVREVRQPMPLSDCSLRKQV